MLDGTRAHPASAAGSPTEPDNWSASNKAASALTVVRHVELPGSLTPPRPFRDGHSIAVLASGALQLLHFLRTTDQMLTLLSVSDLRLVLLFLHVIENIFGCHILLEFLQFVSRVDGYSFFLR